MKQRIRVAAIIRNENGVLILKRNRGRSEAPVFWELPTGKIGFGEQPEEALSRTLSEYLGLSASSIKLKDVITFLAMDGSSRLSNLYIVYDVEIADSAKPLPQDRYNAYKYVKDFSQTNVHLNDATMAVLEIEEGRINPSRFSMRDTANAAVVYVDGASRGNPGPSGIGYCIYDEGGSIIEKGGEFIGFATSRVAEYYAMKKGVERASELGLKTVRVFTDSLMVANQLNGIFSIKNRDIMPIYDDVEKLLSRFENISFAHVPRSENRVADAEANLAIDRIVRRMI